MVLFFAAQGTILGSVMSTWSGAPIDGENPGFLPSGSAVFDISGSLLTVTLTNTSPTAMGGLGEVLTGLTWDISDAGVSLATLTAVIGPGSSLVGNGATGDTDLSSEWAFRDDLDHGESATGVPLGSYGASSVGDLNFQEAWGPRDRFDTTTNLFGPASPNGTQAGIVGPQDGANLFDPPFGNKGPWVQNQMVLTFEITGDLEDGDIENIQPIFGTDGATIIPEPATVIIWSLLGMLGFSVGWWRRRRGETLGAAGPPAMPAARTFWSPETRGAILDIIESGRRRQ